MLCDDAAGLPAWHGLLSAAIRLIAAVAPDVVTFDVTFQLPTAFTIRHNIVDNSYGRLEVLL